MTQEEYIEKVTSATNAADANYAISKVFGADCSSADRLYRNSGVKGLTWAAFYRVREVEEKFGLGYFTSAHIAMSLAFPLISQAYAKMDKNTTVSDKDDFCSRFLGLLVEEILPKWDKNLNDNFFAYMRPNIQTIVNAIRNDDRGISDYMVTTHGLSVNSLDKLRDNPDNNFDVADDNQDVAENVINRMEMQRLSVFARVIGLKQSVVIPLTEDKKETTEEGENESDKNKDEKKVNDTSNNPTEDNIWYAIVGKKLFHSSNEDEIAMADDQKMNWALTKYLDWNTEMLKKMDADNAKSSEKEIVA